MKKLYYLIALTLILGLVLTGCLLSNVGQVPTSEQSGITYLTKGPLSNELVDLVGLWHLDEVTGIIANDSSGNPNDGTLMGDTSWASGNFSNALSFDGDGDYVQLPASNTILNTDTFTIEAWFKTSVNHPVYGGTEGRLVNLHRTTNASTAVSLYVEQDKICLLYYTGTAHKYVKYPVVYYDDDWHHIAVTHDATTYSLYYDGVEVASQDGAFGDFGTYPAYLGTYNGSQRFFNGTIDEVRIWDGALTAEQIEDSADHGIVIQKGMSEDDVFLGDHVTITLEVVTAPAPVTITDTLPDELRYITGTFEVDYVPVTPNVVGQTISYTLDDPCAYTITFDAQVTSVEATLYTVENKATAGDASALADLTINPYAGFTKEAELLSTEDEDMIIEVGEEIKWDVTITVANINGDEIVFMGSIVVQDRFGGELEIESDPLISPGELVIKTSGKTKKPKIKWYGFDLNEATSEAAHLIVFTDINPGGHQSYSTAGEYEMNSGAVLKFIDFEGTGFQLSAHTPPIDVEVFEQLE